MGGAGLENYAHDETAVVMCAGRAAHRGGRGRGGGRWAHHRAALAAAALNNGSAAEDTSGGEGLHDAGSGVQPALAQRPVRTLKPSSKILAANHSNRSPSPPPTRRGRSASAGIIFVS